MIIETDSSPTAYDRVFSSIDYTLGNNVENLLFVGNANLRGIGSDVANRMTGNAGDNYLDGGLGADTLMGGLGNDTYVVDNVGDTISETSTLVSEIDTVWSSVNWTLGANLEYLFLAGTANLNGTGNSLNNMLTGNSGNNILNGGLGADTMTGGLGNDTYYVDNINDVVVETSTLAGEIDTVMASVSYTLGANLENLTLTGTDNLRAVGNAGNNVLIGNAGNNTLVGGAGLDTMIGGDGNDTYNIDQAGELALVVENANEGSDVLNITYVATAQTSVVDLSQASLQLGDAGLRASAWRTLAELAEARGEVAYAAEMSPRRVASSSGKRSNLWRNTSSEMRNPRSTSSIAPPGATRLKMA